MTFSTRIDQYEGRFVQNGDQLPQCMDCGSIVGDRDAHTEWHRALLIHIATSIISGTGASMRGHLAGAHGSAGGDFYEEDEPVADIKATFDGGPHGITASPPGTYANATSSVNATGERRMGRCTNCDAPWPCRKGAALCSLYCQHQEWEAVTDVERAVEEQQSITLTWMKSWESMRDAFAEHLKVCEAPTEASDVRPKAIVDSLLNTIEVLRDNPGHLPPKDAECEHCLQRIVDAERYLARDVTPHEPATTPRTVKDGEPARPPTKATAERDA